MKLFIFLFMLVSLNAEATCFSICEETDEGALATVHCSPPGGPVKTTQEFFKNGCKEDKWIEYVCEGTPGISFPKPVERSSEECT